MTERPVACSVLPADPLCGKRRGGLLVLAAALMIPAVLRADDLVEDKVPEAAHVLGGLHVPSDLLLAPGGGAVAVTEVFEGNYPFLDVAYARGLETNIELDLHGLFHHEKIVGFGSTFTYDFDEGQAEARSGAATGLPGNGDAIAGLGYARFYTRQKYSDGRYSYYQEQFAFVDLLTGAAPLASGGRITVLGRGLRSLDDGMETAAVIAGAELPPLSGLTLLGNVAVFVKNPEDWLRPWAAGGRYAWRRYHLDLFVANTWGTTAPDTLYGTHELFYNVRWGMVF